MPTAQINGIELYYETHGEGPALVLAHGAGGNHLSWWQQVPILSQHFRCVTFDHRGFGSSRDLPNGPGADAFVEDLQQLLDHLGNPHRKYPSLHVAGTNGKGSSVATMSTLLAAQGLRVVRPFAREQLVEHESERVNIARVGDGGAPQLLRRHVCRRSVACFRARKLVGDGRR